MLEYVQLKAKGTEEIFYMTGDTIVILNIGVLYVTIVLAF